MARTRKVIEPKTPLVAQIGVKDYEKLRWILATRNSNISEFIRGVVKEEISAFNPDDVKSPFDE